MKSLGSLKIVGSLAWAVPAGRGETCTSVSSNNTMDFIKSTLKLYGVQIQLHLYVYFDY